MSTGALHPDEQIVTRGQLALFLGGSEDSFTGLLLLLIGKADPVNRARLREAFPREVKAWNTWQATESAPTAAELAAALAAGQQAVNGG
jgi:hypothetical protein